MKNLHNLIHQAEEYAYAYQQQYSITDPALLNFIFVSHLAWLINQS